MTFAEGALDLPPLARFAVLLLGIMAVRWACPRLRLPDCVGYILIGVIVGPHLLGIVPRHADVAGFFAELGKLLLMFFVGLEIDLKQFALAKRRAFAFGLATFAIPMAAGTAVGLAFGYQLVAALLIGSLIASHTLIAFPMVVAAGLAARASVVVAVGATVLTDMLALLVLAGCLATHRTAPASRPPRCSSRSPNLLSLRRSCSVWSGRWRDASPPRWATASRPASRSCWSLSASRPSRRKPFNSRASSALSWPGSR
ncbi:cation:proton antiporter [Roseomonas terrae]|uniref:Cation:proton antiporter n=1 Tax=Neoroseomonas terrae TaxID=424799 RepID=A0ABS5EF15_9PROT|nr:cation:proton antiporter [Neoroseomonas terrae]